MKSLKQKFQANAATLAESLKKFLIENGKKELGKITIDQVHGGMRDMIGLITETSDVHPIEGVRFRGYSIPELQQKMPLLPGTNEPSPESIFYLMLTGELPTLEDIQEVSKDWASRNHIPKHLSATLDALPITMHPMAQFSIGILALQTESEMAKALEQNIPKNKIWEYMYEDAMNLIAKIPSVAAYIYRRTYKNNEHLPSNPNLDWSANFAQMLGFNSAEFADLMRLYLSIHADHEGGNVSAHTCHLVGSAHSDAYYCFSAAMNGLAGPLHGRANQDTIAWIKRLQTKYNNPHPTKQQIEEFTTECLQNGQTVPGYGHAVLRATDPRFFAQMTFAKKHFADDDFVNLVWDIFDTVPNTIKKIKPNVKNPFPNVDAHSGSMLMHYNFTEHDYYTVLFGISRSLGVMAQLCWARYLNYPIERPGSVTFEWLQKFVDGTLEPND